MRRLPFVIIYAVRLIHRKRSPFPIGEGLGCGRTEKTIEFPQINGEPKNNVFQETVGVGVLDDPQKTIEFSQSIDEQERRRLP